LDSPEYKTIQTKYSLIVNDNMRLKQALDETRNALEMSRLAFQRQLEQMESDELAQQKRLGNEMVQLEEQLTQIRKENDLLRIEYEQNVAANEQTAPINKEMRSLIATLQTNNKLLKSDNIRSKKRIDECHVEMERIKKQHSQQIIQLKQDFENTLPKTEIPKSIKLKIIKSEFEIEL
jgi:E3 ubiquitin-protein ligase BRE1